MILSTNYERKLKVGLLQALVGVILVRSIGWPRWQSCIGCCRRRRRRHRGRRRRRRRQCRRRRRRRRFLLVRSDTFRLKQLLDATKKAATCIVDCD